MSTITLPAVNDLVSVTIHGKPTPAVVTAVEAIADDVCVEVRTPVVGGIVVGPEGIRPLNIPNPAPGQRWQCITRPDLIVTVDSVRDGGLLAECRMPDGTPTTLILPGNFEPAAVA
jgi:hypothetical protein